MRLSTPGLFVLAFAAACGGESKPPETPTPAPPASSAPEAPAVPAASGTLSGPTAAPSGDDVKRGIAALKAGDLPGAKAAFDAAIQKDPKKADAHHYRGVVHDQTGAKAEAERDYKRALELDPALEESAVNLAALQIDAGKFDDAVTLMKRAAAKNPRSAAIRVNLAMALAGKGDEPAASKEFEEAIKLDPNNAITVVTYAAHLGRNNKKTEASAQLQKAATLAANDAGVLASVALEHKNLRDFKPCVAVLDRAIAVKDVAELRVYRGTCKLGQKDLPGATADFKDAVAKEPNNAVAHYSLGNALGDGGKLAEAIAEWESYLKLSPDGPMAAAAKKKIEIARKKK